MALKQATVHTLLLVLVMVGPLATAQSVQLDYFGRSDNRIRLACRRTDTRIAVSSPQIWVEQSDSTMPTAVAIVDTQRMQITIEITQDLEGLYFCKYNGVRSTNTLALVAHPQANYIPSSHAFQEGQPATIDCQIMPGKLSQHYSVRWMNGNLTIARSKPRDVLPGYKLHDNFSLTINDIQLSDSSTSYQCIVTIDDPQPQSRNVVYDQLGSITVEVYAPPSIVIPLEPRVIAVIRDSQPNAIFICEATRVPACTPWISWIHNGRNTSESTDQRFQSYISDTSRTIRSRLNVTQLRGRDSGRIDCVASCMVDVPGISRPLVLTTVRNTTLSVLTGDFETVVTVTTAGDVFIRINFHEGYRILDQTSLLMKYTDERSARSRNMTSKQPYTNGSELLLEIPRSRLPYEQFRVQVALKVGNKVGPFVSDGKTHDVTQTRTIIAGTVVGGVVVIAVLLALVICCVCLVVGKNKRGKEEQKTKRHKEEEETKRQKEEEKTKQEIIKEALRSLLNEGYINEYLGLVREQMGCIKQQAEQAKTKRTDHDGDKTDEPFAAFLEEMHKLCTSE